MGQGVNGSSSQHVLSNCGRLALSAVACVNAAASASRIAIIMPGQVWPRRRRLTGRVATGMGQPLWKPTPGSRAKRDAIDASGPRADTTPSRQAALELLGLQRVQPRR